MSGRDGLGVGEGSAQRTTFPIGPDDTQPSSQPAGGTTQRVPTLIAEDVVAAAEDLLQQLGADARALLKLGNATARAIENLRDAVGAYRERFEAP